jgi:genome maintenance exonuclease 1
MENKIYYSVTKILEMTKPLTDKIALANWKNKIGFENAEIISKNALERGKKFDKYVNDYIENKEIPHNKLKEHLNNYEIISHETEIYSKNYNYKGRYDCIFLKNEVLYLNDFKGSEKFKKKEWLKDYPLQISAYIKAYNENFDKKINYGMITIITENDIQKFIYDKYEIETYFNLFIKRYEEYLNLIN